jgi:uncharacterized membrane protein (DUF485 family)
VANHDVAAIARDPRYRELIRRRGRFAGWLSAVMLVSYLGFILVVAFDKPLLAQPIGGGTTSIGIALGFVLILLAIALTGIYVRRANRAFDPLVDALAADHRRR